MDGSTSYSLSGFRFQPLERASKQDFARTKAHSAQRVVRVNDVRAVHDLSLSVPYLDFGHFCGTNDAALHKAYRMLQFSAQYLRHTSKILQRRTLVKQHKINKKLKQIQSIQNKTKLKQRQASLLKSQNAQLNEHLGALSTLLRAVIPKYDRELKNEQKSKTLENGDHRIAYVANPGLTPRANNNNTPVVTTVNDAKISNDKVKNTRSKSSALRQDTTPAGLTHAESQIIKGGHRTKDAVDLRKKSLQHEPAEKELQSTRSIRAHVPGDGTFVENYIPKHDISLSPKTSTPCATKPGIIHRIHGNSEPDFSKVSAIFEKDSESSSEDERESEENDHALKSSNQQTTKKTSVQDNEKPHIVKTTTQRDDTGDTKKPVKLQEDGKNETSSAFKPSRSKTSVLSTIKIIDKQPSPAVSEWTRQQQEIARQKAKTRAMQRQKMKKSNRTDIPKKDFDKGAANASQVSKSDKSNSEKLKPRNSKRNGPKTPFKTKITKATVIAKKQKSKKSQFRLGSSVVVSSGELSSVEQTGYIVKVNPDTSFNIKLDSRNETLYNIKKDQLKLKMKRQGAAMTANFHPSKPPGKPPGQAPRASTNVIRKNGTPQKKKSLKESRVPISTKQIVKNKIVKSGASAKGKIGKNKTPLDDKEVRSMNSSDATPQNSQLQFKITKPLLGTQSKFASPRAQKKIKDAVVKRGKKCPGLTEINESPKSSTWIAGDKVMVTLDHQKKRVSGTVKSVNAVASVADIDCGNGEIQRNIPFANLQRLLTKESIGLKTFTIGQKVLYINAPEEEDLWQDDGDEPQYFLARISKSNNDGSYDIRFEDGEKELFVDPSQLFTREHVNTRDDGGIPEKKDDDALHVGDAVQYQNSDGEMIPASIFKISENGVNVKFHDGTIAENIPLESITKLPSMTVDLQNATAMEEYVEDYSDYNHSPSVADLHTSKASDEDLYQDSSVHFDSVQYDVHGRIIDQEGSLFLTGCETPGDRSFSQSAPTDVQNSMPLASETLNGDGTPFPAPIGSIIRGGGIIEEVNADGTYTVRTVKTTTTMQPGDVYLQK